MIIQHCHYKPLEELRSIFRSSHHGICWMLVLGTPLKESLQSRSQAFQIPENENENENSIKQPNRNLTSNRGEGARRVIWFPIFTRHILLICLWRSSENPCWTQPHTTSQSTRLPASSSAVDSATSKTLRTRPVLPLSKISWVSQMRTMTWIYRSQEVQSAELALSVNISHIATRSVSALLDMRVLILRV